MFHSFKPLEMLIFGVLCLAGGLVVYLLFTVQEAGEDWETFKESHHCQSVGQQAGNQQGGWRCDDGQIHYLWRQQR